LAAPTSGRDFVGYGRNPPDPKWPNGARLALIVVLNFEEGAEPSIPDGDPATEIALTDGIPGEVPTGTRDFVAESLFEYGSRVGFWRLYELFQERKFPVTLGACAQAMERNNEAAAAIREAGFDVCCHGLRFARHFLMTEQEERQTIADAVASLHRTLGSFPTGWQSRYSPSANTRDLLTEHSCFIYDADSYADDLPYWLPGPKGPRLVVPHTFTHNDNRLPGGKIGTGPEFFEHVMSGFRVLYSESARRPRMMTVSLHNRISGQPSRFEGISRFLDEVSRHPDVWLASRGDVARHWTKTHPASGARL
jgi:peptidoglycan/xylan/chitin deacetylase (PgdA/CDA1 family)